ncbi:MAG TPA: RNA 2',3'-cyclic phosphodiesterase [Myxococcaceae bacterium]|nr:RNA 2',3'-cyclic phosphodiesterase [Myxococcaceae bacterium]
MRLFLAGVVPESVKETLQAQLEPVRAATPQARWLPPESLHLTLVFLGSVPDPSVPALQQAFAGVCGRHRAISLTLSGVETFGPARSPRVLATTLGGDLVALHALIIDARQAAEPLVELEPERPFHPHLTVARARSARGDLLLGRCRMALGHALDGGFVLRDVALVRSDTLATGAVHTEFERWTLPG